MALAADVDRAVGERGRGPHGFADRVRANDLVLRAGLDDERVAVLAGGENLPAERNGRRAEGRCDRRAAALVLYFARPGIQTGGEDGVREQIEIVAVENRRGDVRRALVVAPGDAVLGGHIARANRQRDLRTLSGRREDQAVTLHETGDWMAANAVGLPDLFSGRRVVCDDALRARRQKLGPSAGRHQDRRRPAAAMRAGRLPDFLPGAAIEREDVRAFAHLEIVLDDQAVAINERGCAWPHARFGQAAEVRLPLEIAGLVVGVETR